MSISPSWNPQDLIRLIIRRIISQINPWAFTVICVSGLVLIPIICVIGAGSSNSVEIWQHLVSTVLPLYITNSLVLMLGVGVGVLGLGVSTAWLVTMCRFWGDRWLEVLLLLPLAAPAYLLAYVYTEFLAYYGPVQGGLRQIFGWESASDYWFPNVRSLAGAIILLVLVLYPYVYLIVRAAFLEQSACSLEASRSLGCNPWQSFWRVGLPLARPAVMAGLALALMETLNDFGTVEFFGVQTFTTGIYRTWFGLGDKNAASQLATVLMLFILGLIFVELYSRRRARYFSVNRSGNISKSKYQLSGFRAVIAILICLIPIVFGFLLPVGLLLKMTLTAGSTIINESFWQVFTNSIVLAVITAALGVVLAVILAYGKRLNPHNWLIGFPVRVAAMGYAIPGSVIAVGILVSMGTVDNAIDSWMRQYFQVSTGLLISGTIAALIFAYLVRFLAVSFNTVEASLGKIKPHLDDAAHSLGSNSTDTLLRVHTPIISGGLITAIMLVFVDVMKELPATLVIRPFNFDTLAVRVYQYASDERLIEAAAPAIAIVLVGLLPVVLLSWQITKEENKSN
ncbi:ABC-type Fe3+ transport system, permease component [Synechococcus sp. PCC 7502]|uniref:ABC transporter permease n=1 Tax=Synechococcus sp. PCC 7502 TaxID=1173263 RepID=UPI00029F9B72|nr:iron ABC transporter permease [Synechococcus sp. PCC 7502]AFY73679.1 ABC-type Fe3+ transport system, permease component [Synechococcus sp. PCC 7502]